MEKISDILKRKKRVYSFEFFPPKSEKGQENLINALEDLKELAPDFISVTYGAFGSSQEKSLGIIATINELYPFTIMAHYTCIGVTPEKVDFFLQQLQSLGIKNILALRGDPPEGRTIAEAMKDSAFPHAVDLVRYIRKKTGDAFSVGVAGYPECHQECPSAEHDIRYLKEKVDAGADFIITQVFFDNDAFFRFRDRAYTAGIRVPIIPGIMPVENFKQIVKITSLCGAAIPQVIRNYFERTDISEEDKLKFGIECTTNQCRELLDHEVKGIHFYTLNKSSSTREIFKQLYSHM